MVNIAAIEVELGLLGLRIAKVFGGPEECGRKSLTDRVLANDQRRWPTATPVARASSASFLTSLGLMFRVDRMSSAQSLDLTGSERKSAA